MNTKSTLRGPGSSRAVRPRRLKLLALGVSAALGAAGTFALIMAGCGGNGMQPAPPPPQAVAAIQSADVNNIIQTAVNSLNVDMVVAVVDRSGRPLGVFQTANAPAMAPGNFGRMIKAVDVALGLARTGAFFSNRQTPLSSRTVRFISGVHFPPGIANQPNADLYGIENTNRGCFLVPPSNMAYNMKVPTSVALGSPPGAGDGPGILTGKADMFDSDPNAVNPAGFPIFLQSTVVGGIGVVTANTNLNVAEFAAFTGAQAPIAGTNPTQHFSPIPNPFPAPQAVFIAGISLPFVLQTTIPNGMSPRPNPTFMDGETPTPGMYVANTPGNPPFPITSTGQPPETPPGPDLVPAANGPIGGLTAQQVETILDQATAEANLTRAAIRLPVGERTRMVIAVADLDGTIIGLRRMKDATVFSIDVAATKARNMTFFNTSARTANDMTGVPMGTAVTNRTISFGSQTFFPPGINDSDPGPPFTNPGPFFNLFVNDLNNPCSQGFQGATLPTGQTVMKSGIVFFPGSTGIFVNGQLVGGLGVSGDGVDQDDFVTAAGIVGFAAPDAIRADQIFVRNVRLPYMKFPRNPTD